MMPLEISACRKVLLIKWSIAAALVFATFVGLLKSGKMVWWKPKLKAFAADGLLE